MESNVLLIFLLGASIGSFINVIVYRVPKKNLLFLQEANVQNVNISLLGLITSQLLVGFYCLANAEDVKLISILITQ